MTYCVGPIRRTPWARRAIAVFGGTLLACGATLLGATETQVATARDRASAGANVYTNECARCHGRRGEGLAGAPPILGPGALPEYPRDTSGGMQAVTDPDQIQIQQQTRPSGAPRRDQFHTAQDLYAYVRVHLPKARAAGMKADDYWAVVTFLFAAQGADVPTEGIGPNNADSFPIPR
jgi:mono/diheme cytochrome c family protein